MKPSAILSELEREPVVYFGCTWTEIGNSLRKGIVVGLIAAILAGIVASIFMSISLSLVLSMVAMLATTTLYTRTRLRRIAGLRAGKPLFYERHVQTSKSARFIRPARRYQRERNQDATKKKK